MIRTQKTLFTFATVLMVTAFLGLYGHAMVDDHGAEDVCHICALLQTGAQVGVLFSFAVLLVSYTKHVSFFPLSAVCLPVATLGRSPPVA